MLTLDRKFATRVTSSSLSMDETEKAYWNLLVMRDNEEELYWAPDAASDYETYTLCILMPPSCTSKAISLAQADMAEAVRLAKMGELLPPR